jgi:hypothetical protein
VPQSSCGEAAPYGIRFVPAPAASSLMRPQGPPGAAVTNRSVPHSVVVVVLVVVLVLDVEVVEVEVVGASVVEVVGASVVEVVGASVVVVGGAVVLVVVLVLVDVVGGAAQVLVHTPAPSFMGPQPRHAESVSSKKQETTGAPNFVTA